MVFLVVADGFLVVVDGFLVVMVLKVFDGLLQLVGVWVKSSNFCGMVYPPIELFLLLY